MGACCLVAVGSNLSLHEGAKSVPMTVMDRRLADLRDKRPGQRDWTASWLPFGGVHVTSGAPIEARFPGQWFQAESGLHQNWMRDYDPTTGRYLEPDPLGLVDGASIYGYARQSPQRWTDPRGEEVFVVCRPLAGIAGVSGAKHCAVFVVQYDCTCSGSSQFSLGRGDTTFNSDRVSSRQVALRDRDAFDSFGNATKNFWGDIDRYHVDPPPGMSDCDYEYRLVSIATEYEQGPYRAMSGPNSNTAVRQLIERSGGRTAAAFDGAVGEHYSGR